MTARGSWRRWGAVGAVLALAGCSSGVMLDMDDALAEVALVQEAVDATLPAVHEHFDCTSVDSGGIWRGGTAADFPVTATYQYAAVLTVPMARDTDGTIVYPDPPTVEQFEKAFTEAGLEDIVVTLHERGNAARARLSASAVSADGQVSVRMSYTGRYLPDRPYYIRFSTGNSLVLDHEVFEELAYPDLHDDD